MVEALSKWLLDAAETALDANDRHAALGAAPGSLKSNKPLARAVVEDLLATAFAEGLQVGSQSVEEEELSGGNTAEKVAILRLTVPFVFKLDANTPKLAAEARTMRAIRADLKLPAEFREAWPTIFAVRDEAPFAYLMEYFPKSEGWVSLEERLYANIGRSSPSGASIQQMMNAVLDVLFSGYAASINRRALPSLAEDYVDRIAERLKQAERVDSRFRPQQLVVNGRQLKPWSDYLELIRQNRNRIMALTPPFTTVVHGDPNPGNLLLRESAARMEVKLIDPKEWHTGDYLFDIAKIVHFVEGTGPVERPAGGALAVPRYESGTAGTSINYDFATPTWTSDATAQCRGRVAFFAAANGDGNWEQRLSLALAANLLGLPIGRLTHRVHPKPDAALILYCEGLKHLDAVCASW